MAGTTSLGEEEVLGVAMADDVGGAVVVVAAPAGDGEESSLPVSAAEVGEEGSFNDDVLVVLMGLARGRIVPTQMTLPMQIYASVYVTKLKLDIH